jgi:hypothetical protein
MSTYNLKLLCSRCKRGFIREVYIGPSDYDRVCDSCRLEEINVVLNKVGVKGGKLVDRVKMLAEYVMNNNKHEEKPALPVRERSFRTESVFGESKYKR